MCCTGQPVVLVGDFNADPTVVPSLAKGIMDGHWIDIEQAFATGRGVAPSRTCQFQLDEDKGSGRDFVLAGSIAMAATTPCRVLPDRWFVPHFAVYAEFSLSLHGMPLSIELGSVHSCGQLVGLIGLIAPGRSPSHAVQNIWDVYIQEVGFVSREVREQLFTACNSPDVDASWLLWNREAEASLARAYLFAGGPPPLKSW